jgi:GTPase SAR1 family protein
MPQLDIKKELSDIQTLYNNSPNTQALKLLLYGPMGSGKTNLLRTARQPVLLHSFDPGGTKTVRDEIKAGQIIADTRYEVEDPMNPTAFQAWDNEYHRLKNGGVFNKIGTFAIDSGTTWSSAAMNVILKRAGRPGSTPQQNDYLPTMVLLENAIKDMTSLPCDVILICHEDTDKDEASGRLYVGPLFIGKLKYRIPILFDEVYYATTKETSSGVNYFLLTRSTGLYKARTRLGKGGLFETYEVQDIKALLKKAGYSTEDKVI